MLSIWDASASRPPLRPRSTCSSSPCPSPSSSSPMPPRRYVSLLLLLLRHRHRLSAAADVIGVPAEPGVVAQRRPWLCVHRHALRRLLRGCLSRCARRPRAHCKVLDGMCVCDGERDGERRGRREGEGEGEMYRAGTSCLCAQLTAARLVLCAHGTASLREALPMRCSWRQT